MPIFDSETVAKILRADTKLLVFAVVRNEIIRIPSWLSHYRAAGCTSFVVIDNGSTDGTYEFLADQEGVICLQTEESFGQSNCGINWLNELRVLVAPHKWILAVDADELFIYRGWPDKTILDLVEEVEEAGCTAVWAYMLDMYPDGPIDPTTPPAATTMFELAPCFDGDYKFHYPNKKPWEKSFPNIEVVGGPRLRFFSRMDKEIGASWMKRFIRGQMDRLLPITPDALLPWLFRYAPQALPTLFKSPLSKADGVIKNINSHGVSDGRHSQLNGVLCHFKFLGDFSMRVTAEVGRKEHYRKGAEYFRYSDMIRKHKNLDFRYPGTRKFESARQLEELGLLTSRPVERPACGL